MYRRLNQSEKFSFVFLARSIFIFAKKIKIQTNSDDVIDCQNGVRHCKNPIFDSITVNGESDRRQNLTDEKPARNAFGFAVFPLFINLSDECEK